MNEELKNIFKNFKVDNKSIEIAHLRYKGKSKTYGIWTIIEEIPGLCCDDEVQYSIVTVDIDIYSDGNYLNIVKQIKRIMKENEWNWIEDSEEMYEDDTELYHKTITFEKERKI
jgi:hypothetical protein